MASDPDDVLSLVGTLYDAALDPAAWPAALDQLSDFTDSQFAHVFFVDSNRGPAPTFAAVSQGAPDTGLNRYHARYEALDPRRVAGAKQPAGIVVPDWSMVRQDDFLKTEFYNDFYAPLGLRWLACSTIVKTGSFMACLGLTRGIAADPYGAEDCRRAAHVLPHLARAATIQHRIGSLEADMHAGFGALDRLPIGLVVIGEAGRPVFVNRAAERILAEDDGLLWDEETGLSAVRHEDTRALHAAIRRATSIEKFSALKDWDVVRVARRSFSRPYVVLAAPASQRGGLVRQDQGAAAYVLIQDPDSRARARPDVIAALYGLTPAEADVASRLASGYPLSTIAKQRGSSVSTVRWLLKQAMAKTDTHSQAHLVSLLLAGATTFES